MCLDEIPQLDFLELWVVKITTVQNCKLNYGIERIERYSNIALDWKAYYSFNKFCEIKSTTPMFINKMLDW